MSEDEIFAALWKHKPPHGWKMSLNGFIRTDDAKEYCPLCWVAKTLGMNSGQHKESFRSTELYGRIDRTLANRLMLAADGSRLECAKALRLRFWQTCNPRKT